MIKKTVIISCAGTGSRLGFNLPKCLVDIENKKLLEIQLEQLQDVEDVRVVVGYKKELVKELLESLNYNNVKIYENNNYMNTGTAGSFCSALDGTENEYIIALDGDLIVDPLDMEKVLNSQEEIICGEEINTENPVLVSLDTNGNVIEFSREYGQYEWAGLAQIKKEKIKYGDKHIYQLLEPILPIKFQLINAKEIDTINDLKNAQEWYRNNTFFEKRIMDDWFKSRFDITDDYIASRHSLNSRIDYDINLIKKYATSESRVLDLGCGTGILETQLENIVKYIKAIDKYQEFINRAAIKSTNIDFEKHDVSTYYDEKIYDLILLFGVTIYLFDSELEATISNCINMMKNESVLIIKNQWSTNEEDVIVNKQYSDTNKNKYYGIYRSLTKMKTLIEKYKMSCEIVDIYPKNMNSYENTHEYALICKKIDNN